MKQFETTADKIVPLNKGLGDFSGPMSVEQIVAFRWNLLHEDLTLPAAILYHNRVAHNLRWMQQFVHEYNVLLAPHGKTTMAPKLFAMQLRAGAWGITVATAQQASVAYAHGVRRVLMANQLIGLANMTAIARMLIDPTFEFYCLVDSASQVEQLGAFFMKHGLRLSVLLELGVEGGRSGTRNEKQLREVVLALDRWQDSVVLSGIEVYEGVIEKEKDIREFLQHAVTELRILQDESRFRGETVLLSGAGSAWYDVVADVFSAANSVERVQIVLRPGCYITHDAGAYKLAQARIEGSNLAAQRIAREMEAGLVPALQIWAYIHSIPEPQKAIVGLGKRDCAFDAGLPIAALHYRPGNPGPKLAPTHWKTTRMMDQHTYLRISEKDDVQVGDMISFDICHPCLTFDKWRTLVMVNEAFDVVDIVPTFF